MKTSDVQPSAEGQMNNMLDVLNEHTSTTNLSLDELPKTRRFGFSIGNIHYLVPEGLYCELLVDLDISPLPNTPSHVRGIINLRGNILPIYSLSAFTGQKDIAMQYAYLIGNTEDGAALFINDKPILVDLTDITEEAPPTTLPEYIKPCIDASYLSLGKRWLSLDPTVLFNQLAAPVEL